MYMHGCVCVWGGGGGGLMEYMNIMSPLTCNWKGR